MLASEALDHVAGEGQMLGRGGGVEHANDYLTFVWDERLGWDRLGRKKR